MNDIQRASWRFRLLRLTLYPFWVMKWFVVRQRNLLAYLAAARHASELEKEIQRRAQEAFNADHAGKVKELHYALGYINGIRYCLERKWNHGRGRTN
jgi:hypothetical protein